jgi:hypothetical protein
MPGRAIGPFEAGRWSAEVDRFLREEQVTSPAAAALALAARWAVDR